MWTGSLRSVFTLFSLPYSESLGLLPSRNGCSELAWLQELGVHISSCAPGDTGKKRGSTCLLASLEGGFTPFVSIPKSEEKINCYQPSHDLTNVLRVSHSRKMSSRCPLIVPSVLEDTALGTPLLSHEHWSPAAAVFVPHPNLLLEKQI